MSDSAIHEDVQQEVSQEPNTPATPTDEAPKQRPKTAREIAMEELEARHQQQLASENGYQLGEPMTEAAAPEPAAAAPAPDQLAAQLAADPSPAVVPSTIKVKVDGTETDVPLDEVVRQYQKNSSADRRLAEATRLLREAQEAQARLLEQQHHQQQLAAQVGSAPAAAADPASAADPAPDVEEAGKQFLKALFEGDEESALTKLKELTTAGRPAAPVQQPTLDLDQISSAVAQHVQQKLAVESALAKNRADYPQLYADPDIESLAVAKIERLREESGMDFFAALDTVSREFSAKFGWNQPAEQGRQDDPSPTTTSRQAKLERKAAIDNVAAVNTKLTTAEPVPEDASSIIAQIKAARGQ